MIRRLADRLVSVDLLEQAAELLQHQVDHRLQGAARAQVATRLAVIYLMNRKPDRTLATLRATRVADLSNDIRNQRLLLEARALSDLGRNDVALEVIANIPGREKIRLRADILWAARRWREAAEEIELLHGDRWREFEPLAADERRDILRAGIAFVLGEDPIGLGRLREKYAGKIGSGPDRHAFDVVTAPVEASGTEFREVARAIAAIDTLDAFLRDLRSRYPETAAALSGQPRTELAAPNQKPDPTPTGTARATCRRRTLPRPHRCRRPRCGAASQTGRTACAVTESVVRRTGASSVQALGKMPARPWLQRWPSTTQRTTTASERFRASVQPGACRSGHSPQEPATLCGQSPAPSVRAVCRSPQSRTFAHRNTRKLEYRGLAEIGRSSCCASKWGARANPPGWRRSLRTQDGEDLARYVP